MRKPDTPGMVSERWLDIKYVHIVKEYMCVKGLVREDVNDREKWRRLSWGSQNLPVILHENLIKTPLVIIKNLARVIYSWSHLWNNFYVE